MRTLTRESFFLRKRIASLVHGKHCYSVSGIISFNFDSHRTEPDLGGLAVLIRDVDRMFPWHNEPAHPDFVIDSIGDLSKGEVVVHDFVPPLKIAYFHIVPGRGNLQRAQAYAYEKYLAKLAEELAKKKPYGVAGVCSIIKIRSATKFEVE